MSSLARSKSLAICAVGGSIATAGYMYIAGKQTKAEEGPESIYSESTCPAPGKHG
ncbi:hypothetical protein EW026_g7048 [Hermanssonia centrifuga]|uniref:Uncharacterized protein n=1 Tax=Hermanssonia centrifuga TaxID=98765 RepID=A0A4S4K941_9APHY|nr:hypothetical protein EW026_g7048 [Hermanssonia centrifuga]